MLKPFSGQSGTTWARCVHSESVETPTQTSDAENCSWAERFLQTAGSHYLFITTQLLIQPWSESELRRAGEKTPFVSLTKQKEKSMNDLD